MNRRRSNSQNKELAMFRPTFAALCLLLTMASSAIAQKSADPKPQPSQEELEKQFAETMSGATLVGRFTVTGQDLDKPLKQDRYTLGKVSKLKNGLWQFETRIQYGDHDVKLPLALEVKWAGDTPVITLTNIAVPPLGTFSARVLVYKDEYAGTWSGGDHGGQMIGRIERAGAAKPAEKSEK
jgi:hypothetical protein